MVCIETPIHSTNVELKRSDLLVSYGYRHLIRSEQLTFFSRPPINLHISLLPWNRGADPNLWSFLEDSPKGISIHTMDRGLDTGSLLLQKEIQFSENETLQSSYDKLQHQIQLLFQSHWKALRNGEIATTPQKGQGSLHRLVDKKPYLPLLSLGWNTPVRNLIGKAR